MTSGQAKRVTLTQTQADTLEKVKKLPEFQNTDNILDAQATDPEGWGGGLEALNGLDYDLLARALAEGYEIGVMQVAAEGIYPKYGWRETFESKVSMEMDVHNGKRFTILGDITDPAVRDDPDYGYVRVYRVRLEDGKVITAFDVEVELLEDPS